MNKTEKHRRAIKELLTDGKRHDIEELNGIAYRYSARLFELKEQGSEFDWFSLNGTNYYKIFTMKDLFNADEAKIYEKRGKRGFMSRGLRICDLLTIGEVA